MTVLNMKKINRKIPGTLPPPPKTDIDGKVTNLSDKSIPELLELKDRQLKLIKNKVFISKLPDKGAKIQAFYDRILQELQAKQEDETTCCLLDRLKLDEVDKKSIQNIEWEGKLETQRDCFLDSDDDSDPEDVLQILSKCTSHEKQVKVIQDQKSLITPEDVISIGEIPHVKYIVEKTESKSKPKPTGQFKPFKTTKSDVHNPAKEIQRKKHKHWEVTAATPPPIVHGPAKVLSLEESLKLQKEHSIHLKEIEVQHAAEKLLERTGIKMPEIPIDTSKFGLYREAISDNNDSDDSDLEGSDKEVHDEEPERGGVVFTVMK